MNSFYEKIPIQNLFISDKNVRKTINQDDESNLETLTNDIKINGLINPLSVRKINNNYEIYAGQRRYLALKNLNWKEVPCIINDYNDAKIELLSLAENIQRNKMSIVDKCNIFYKYYELNNKSVEEVAKLTSMTENTIKSYIFIKENLDTDLLPKLDEKYNDKLPLQTATDLCKNIPDKEKQKEVFEKTKKLPNAESKKNVIEKIKNNPDKDIDNILEEEDQETKFNPKEPWLFDPDHNKVNIPKQYYKEIYNLIKEDL